MMSNIKRLYTGFRPINYNLFIDIDEPNMEFKGKVIISGKKVGRPSQRLTFHQKDLKILNAKVTKLGKKGQENINIQRIHCHKTYDELRLHADEMLYPGEYLIEIEYVGKFVEDQTVGFYPSSFEYNGKTEYIFTTQFESHHARQVFPCIDEPEAKATFDLKIQTKSDVTVLSNTSVLNEKTLNEGKITTFETSPVMSCYLLAFVIGKMHFVETTTKRGIKLRSYSSIAQAKDKLQFSVNEASKIIDFYEDYFGVNFPLKKCDQVAIPDFESGAMENWGLITYREIALLTDPTNRSISSEQYVAMVIAHELSHQWFGNLVTMKWWDDLWLNESFASIMEHIALDNLHPDWHQWEDYASQDILRCSNRDIYKDVQNVGVEVKHPDEISSLFDPAIVYAKGGRLIKMLIDYIGEEAFKTGLNKYFQKFAYKNTTRDDLWQCMNEASQKDIVSLMTPWIKQSGMPLVTVSLSTYDNQRTLNQERFVLDESNDNSRWPIPLLSDEKLNIEVFDKTEQTIKFENDLPVINHLGSGHFVTLYSEPSDKQKILSKITHKDFSSQSKINILNELCLLAKANKTSLIDSLELIDNMKSESRDAVWSLMLRSLNLAATIGEFNDKIENGIKTFRQNLAKENYQKLGWQDQKYDDPNTIHLRATMIGLMLAAENSDSLKMAKEIFESHTITNLPAERRVQILSVMVRHFETEKLINDLTNEYSRANDPEVKQAISIGLCSTKSAETAEKLLQSGLIKDGFVRPQDYFYWVAYLMRNKYTRAVAWQWLKNNWAYLDSLFGGSKSLDNFINFAAGPIQTKEMLNEFKLFFDPMLNQPALSRNITIAKSEIQSRIEWRDRELPKLEQYFKI